MKYLYLLLVVPSFSYASFGKPELIARMNAVDAWNIPDNFWCFTGEPVSHKNRIHLNCMDYKGQAMAQWDNKKFNLVARADEDNIFTGLTSSLGKITWYEANEYSIQRSYQSTDSVSKIDISNLGPMSDSNDSFLPYTADSFFFKSKGEDPQLWIWKNNVVTPFFKPDALYIFTPQVGPTGEIAFKTRSNDLAESGADRIWHFNNGEWKVILEDQDANPSSPWRSIRNQLSVEGDKVLVIAKDDLGEALLLIDGSSTKIIARAGKELARFDFFSPKMKAGTIIVRGEDFKGNKVTFVKDEGHFRSLLSQGDIVHTDIGLGKVHYSNQDSIFYGAAGIDENGNVILQATLTDPDHPRTLLGIGLIKFQKE